MIDLKRHWWPLATLAELDSGKPLARMLHGVPLVLWRTADGQIAALHDRCAHRHAPLSCGKAHHDQIGCPYHGWRFDAQGRCTEVPGMDLKRSDKPIVPAFATHAAHGLAWVCLAPDEGATEPVSPSVCEGVDAFFITDTVQCGIAEAAENFLDGFHTHFVHAGWIRRDSTRQSVKVQVRKLDDGIEARYSDEGLQSGVISRWLEGSRTESFGRFRLPGVAEIEYRGKRGLNLLITAWLTPETPDRLRIHARIATRRGLTPAWVKKLFLRRLFGVILKQDKTILEQTQANIVLFEQSGCKAPLLDTPLDLLGPSIRRLLEGHSLDDAVNQEFACRI